MDSKTMLKPHAICIPAPGQGHLAPMIHLAKLLWSRGVSITIVNTEFNHRRLVRSGAIDPTIRIEGFRFEAIPDGLPPSDINVNQDVMELIQAIMAKNMLGPIKELILRLNADSHGGPPVSCMVIDSFMAFAQPLADEFGIPDLSFWTEAGCTLMALLHGDELIQRGYTPFKDASYLSNGYLDNTRIDWIPAMPCIRLKDLPTFIRTADANDTMFNFCLQASHSILKASAVVLNAFRELENETIEAAKQKFKLQETYVVGPLFALSDQIPPSRRLDSIQSNLWIEEKECMEWLDKRDQGSVVYVNFGSVTVLTPEQLKEFAWGLANSNHPFMWVIRSDIVSGQSAVLEKEFLEETKERGILASWCAQKQVLDHPSVGAFLTHSGWNSTMESIHSGVPMLCWPFFSDQVTNCRFACDVWGIGKEIDNKVKREKLESAIKELMEGEKGKEMRKNAMKWKEEARKATLVGGSSHSGFDRLVNDLLLFMKR